MTVHQQAPDPSIERTSNIPRQSAAQLPSTTGLLADPGPDFHRAVTRISCQVGRNTSRNDIVSSDGTGATSNPWLRASEAMPVFSDRHCPTISTVPRSRR
jgi:hypothetical protein